MNPSPGPKSVSRTYLRRSVPALFSVLLIAGGAAWLTFNHLAGVLDQQILDHSRFLAAKALEQSRKAFVSSVAAQAAVASANRRQPAGAQAPWTAEQTGSEVEPPNAQRYENVLVMTAQGQPLYSSLSDQPAQSGLNQRLQGDLPRLLDQARLSGSGQTAFAYMHFEGRPAMVAGQLINGVQPAAILVVINVMSREELVRLGLDYSLTEFRFLARAPGPQVPTIQVDTNDGATLAFSWYPPTFAGEMFGDIAPEIIFASVLVLALLGLIIHDAGRGAKALERSYAQLAQSEKELAVGEARFRDIAEAASDWLWETDLELRLVYLSERFSQITGVPAHLLLGESLDHLLRVDGVMSLADALRNANAKPVQCYYTSAEGRERICRLASRPVLTGNVAVGYRGTASDITEELEAQAKVLHMSQHDALTGLPNRNRLRQFLEDRLGQGQPVVLLSLDLDRFKAVNDTLGHAAGDSVLHEVSRRLRACVREADLVARLGGDEFILVIDDPLPQADIDTLCARMISEIQQPFFYEEQQIFIGTSIGAALAPLDATDADELMRCADVALYQSKADGRGTWRFYASELNYRLIHRRQLELDLRHALDHGQLLVYYQPRFRLDGMRMIGAEALVRWQHPERGLLLPEEFLPLAEDTGLIVPLGEWVLGEACRAAMLWPSQMLVSVNLSTVQFGQGDMLEVVDRALQASGLPAARLELEVTESVLLEDAAGALNTLNALKRLGVRLTMDDFGTGYSSLNYLRTYPFDGLKIDRSFIATLNESDSDRSIVQAVVSLAQALRMTVTAEGVETPEQLAALLQEDCAEAQGFHLSRPQTGEHLLSLIAEQTASHAGA